MTAWESLPWVVQCAAYVASVVVLASAVLFVWELLADIFD